MTNQSTRDLAALLAARAHPSATRETLFAYGAELALIPSLMLANVAEAVEIAARKIGYRPNPDENAPATPATARANRTLAARAAVDAAGDALTVLHDALRAADGMPRMQQVEAFESAAHALAATLRDSIAADILETE